MKAHCIEIATFRLKTGINDADFIEVEQKNRQGIITEQAGYISRELAKSADGEWLMIMRFDTSEHLHAWLNKLKETKALSEMGAMIDFASMQMRVFQSVV